MLLCTPCSKRKRRVPKERIAAAERYLSRRIRRVLREAERRGVVAMILSGRYGLLPPRRSIPWYDRPLLDHDVPAMAERVARQLRALRAETLELWARPASTPGWRPYHEVLRIACDRAGVRLRRVVLGPDWT